MNEKIIDQFPEDLRTSVVPVKQNNFQLVAISDPIMSNRSNKDEYEQRVAPHIEYLNRHSQILERDKNSLALEIQERMKKMEPVVYNGERVFRVFHAAGGQNRQTTMESFLDFTSSASNFVWDIETLGDTQDQVRPFHVTEISMNRYTKYGTLIEEGYNGLIRLDPTNPEDRKMIEFLSETLNKIEADKYYFNTLPDWHKRSVVDLMRYATYMEEGDKYAFSLDGGVRHHSIIDSVFNIHDEIDHDKVIQNMDSYLKYMRSGLESIQKYGDTKEEALNKVIRLIRENPDQFFVTYNGSVFDLPVLKAFAEKHGKSLPEFKHLDLLNVIRTVYYDSDELKRMVNPDYVGSEYRKDKLAAWVKDVLGIQDGGEHQARTDTDNTAKVLAAVRDPIHETIIENKDDIREGFHFFPNQMTWNDEPLREGQTLFANRGVVAYGDMEESFVARLAEDGKWVRESDNFNKTVIRSRTFYQFAGIQELENGKLAFRFYDPERDTYSFIVRSGDSKTGVSAFEQLRDFVQSRFYNFDGATEEQKSKLRYVAGYDRARRRYERFFSLEGAGSGLTIEDGQLVERGTQGFSGLKRMLHNAEIMEKYLSGKGEAYRKRVRELREAGFSESEAKAMARPFRPEELLDYADADNPAHAKLMDMLDFNSRWDPVAKRYVRNEAEEEAFFYMYNRLIDEKPYLQEVVARIDEAFGSDIERAMAITDDTKRRETLRRINQQRDLALVNYWRQVESYLNKKGVQPPVMTRDLLPMEGNRLSFFDPEVAGDGRRTISTLNFESVSSATSSIYNYAKRGVDMDSPNKNQLIRERADNLIGLLHSQGKITTSQRDEYRRILFGPNTPYQAIQEIAASMRQLSADKFMDVIEETDLRSNKAIQQLEPAINKGFIEQAIRDAQNAFFVINLKDVKGHQVKLSNQILDSIRKLDEGRLSHYPSNNLQALEHLISAIHKRDRAAQIAIAMDPNDTANVRLYVYDRIHGATVVNQLARGITPTQALEIQMPLINKQGAHKFGSMLVNARQIAVREGEDLKIISTAEQIARTYEDRLSYILDLRKEGRYEEATKAAKKVLYDEIKSLAGIQRSMELGPNDVYVYANTPADFLKQSHIDVSTAMIEDIYYRGFNGITISEKDFFDPDSVFHPSKYEGNKRMLRPGVTFEDLKMKKSYELLMAMPEWARERLGVEGFTNALKAEHVSLGRLALEDIRALVPYGGYFDHGRDNLIQYHNVYNLLPESEEALKNIKGVTRKPLLKTKRQLEMENAMGGNQYSMYGKVAYMTDQQFRERIKEIYESDEGRKLFKELELLTEDGSIDWVKLPRVYENQSVIAEDLADALWVTNEKRYVKGSQFEPSAKLKNNWIMPGDLLGVRIHDTGYREEIYYEGKHPARLIQGKNEGEDIILQWKERPFKFLFDGEKTTDTTVDRRLIRAITGENDIVAIINPNVYKHKDFGMLMAGEARMLSEYVMGLGKKKREKVIRMVENAGVGLIWDENLGHFIDISYDLAQKGQRIHVEAFDNLYKQLGISNTTKIGGYRKGILDIRMAKVENYSKAADETGQRVIWIDPKKGTKRYASGYDGVKFGHRELGILKREGLEESYNFLLDFMKERQWEQELRGEVSRFREVQGLLKSFEYMIEDAVQAEAISAGKFEPLPELFRNKRTYQGTIFDREAVQNLVERYGMKHAMTGHGFWLKLPEVTRPDGSTKKVTIPLNLTGERKAVDKLFIPFTNLEGANGNVYLRTLQQRIATVYEKARAVDLATTIEDARVAHEQLQEAVDRYVEQGFYELTSSKGMLLEDVLKVPLSGTTSSGVKVSSASGLFKLMDLETSLEYAKQYGDGHYTVISPITAKKIGIYDQLKAGKELYVSSVRYPAFHPGAIQFTRVMMDPSVREGEFHTTSFASFLQNADSDGDYGYIGFIDKNEIQEEWKRAHDRMEKRFADQWEAHLEKSAKEGIPVSISRIAKELDPGKEFLDYAKAYSDSETASKIGKITIGRASNLNLYITQLADRFLPRDSDLHYKFIRFGQGIEQEPISSKHGGKPVGLELIEAVYDQDWEKAKYIDTTYFDSKFQKEFYLDEVSKEMPMLVQRLRNELRTEGLKVGTSTGIGPNYGVESLVDLMQGKADPREYGRNQALEMYYKVMGVEHPLDSASRQEPIKKITHEVVEEQRPKKSKVFHRMYDKLEDTISKGSSTFERLADSVRNSSMKKLGLLGGALAIAGVAGYNILSSEKPETHYNNEIEPALQMDFNENDSMQNATIEIEASGGPIEQSQLSNAVVQSMQNTRMHAGPTRVSINYQDNTTQLNRQWYRDKVQENI